MHPKYRTLHAAIVSLLMLNGCVARLAGANEAGGVISTRGDLRHGKTFELADAHCRKYGRLARFSEQDEGSNTVAFSCVRLSEPDRRTN